RLLLQCLGKQFLRLGKLACPPIELFPQVCRRTCAGCLADLFGGSGATRGHRFAAPSRTRPASTNDMARGKPASKALHPRVDPKLAQRGSLRGGPRPSPSTHECGLMSHLPLAKSRRTKDRYGSKAEVDPCSTPSPV